MSAIGDTMKGWTMAKQAMDELEMHNYLELLRQANQEGLLNKDKYHAILLKYIDAYESKS